MKKSFLSLPVLALGVLASAAAGAPQAFAGGPYADRSKPSKPAVNAPMLDLPLPNLQEGAPPVQALPAMQGTRASSGVLDQLEVAALHGHSALLRYAQAGTAQSAMSTASASQNATQPGMHGAGGASARSYRTIVARDNEEVWLDGQGYVAKVGDEWVKLYAVTGRKVRSLAWIGYLNGPDLLTAAPSGEATYTPPLAAGADFSRGAGSSTGTVQATPAQTASPATNR